MEIMQTSE